MLEDLQSDSYGLDYYSFSDKVCPKCEAWDCVELEYENINEALKRNENTKE